MQPAWIQRYPDDYFTTSRLNRPTMILGVDLAISEKETADYTAIVPVIVSYVAYFTDKEKKVAKIVECVFVLDTLKFLITTAWEGRLIANKQCEDVAKKLDEIGKMFGGWKKNLENPERKNRAM